MQDSRLFSYQPLNAVVKWYTYLLCSSWQTDRHADRQMDLHIIKFVSEMFKTYVLDR